MYELLTCQLPWTRSDKTFTKQILGAVHKGERPQILQLELDTAPPEYLALMYQCWDNDAAVRPTFKRLQMQLKLLLAHEFTNPSSGHVSGGGRECKTWSSGDVGTSGLENGLEDGVGEVELQRMGSNEVRQSTENKMNDLTEPLM